MLLKVCSLFGQLFSAEVSYRDDAHAIENAALAALMYLEGFLDNNTPSINVSACGFHPPPKLSWNEDVRTWSYSRHSGILRFFVYFAHIANCSLHVWECVQFV